VDLVGATVLSELAALVEGARLVLTNNTSTMHLLDALARRAWCCSRARS
jgi:ADP-heptose:LPS heptosyltransferase